MLKIFFGDMEDAVYAPNRYFDNTYDPEWITSDFGRKLIADIDKSTVIGPNLIDSPALGPIGPRDIAGGTKAVLLMKFDKSHVFNASKCGDNCAKWILEIGNSEDLTINLRHYMDFGGKPFEILVLNTNKVVTTGDELLSEAYDYIYRS